MEYCPECGAKLKHVKHEREGYKGMLHLDYYECPNGHRWIEEYNEVRQQYTIFPCDECWGEE